jgi:hypothetical protein
MQSQTRTRFTLSRGLHHRAIRDHAKSADKTLAYVEGATHGFTPCTACAIAQGKPANYYGDTVKTLFDYIDKWLSKPGRFQQ